MNHASCSILMKKLAAGFAALMIVGQLAAQTLTLHQSNENGVYQKGETVRMTLSADKPLEDSIQIRVDQNLLSRYETYKIAAGGERTLVFERTFDRPVSVMVEASCGTRKVVLGAIVAPQEMTPASLRPDDLEAFWQEQRKALRSLPMRVDAVDAENRNAGFLLQDVSINTTSSRPVRGYLAKPEKAKPRSLPIVVSFHAAGVKGNWCLSNPATALHYAQAGSGAIAFDMNAHGMLNGQPKEYYEYLENYTLKDYQINGFEHPNDCYFLGMYVRLMRALDYLTSLPEWDGKRILVMGESQGGGQALAAAGLDKRVTAVVATVPAMCDWGSPEAGRKAGWPDPLQDTPTPSKMKTAPYFDCAHLLKGCKATLVVEIGLADTTCPSHSIFAALHQAQGEKIILTAPYRMHTSTQTAFYNNRWNKEVADKKRSFIQEYLR